MYGLSMSIYLLLFKIENVIHFNLTLEWVTHNVNRSERRKQTENLTLFSDITVFTSADFADPNIFNYRVNSPG